jgi:ribosomal-protein-alanine N-acetyltransferase
VHATVIETERLRLVPHEPAYLVTLIEAPGVLAERFELPAAAGLRELFVGGDPSPTFLALLRSAPALDPWTLGFALVERSSGVAVGSAGFKGAPGDDGVVEIAYALVPTSQGRGYATEAANALVRFAATDRRVRRIRAHTLPEPNASTRVLAKSGFTCVGTVDDPEDGPVWRWERRPRAPISG